MAGAIRIGIIGYDTSHAPAFARVLNDESHRFHVSGGRVVCGYPSYSVDVDASRSRIRGLRREMAELHVREVDSIADLLDQVDAVLLESVDGRRHLPEARPVFEAGKPVFIDKPFAADYDDARAIARLANEHDARVFSSSSLRYDVNIRSVLDDPGLGAVFACDAFSPATLESTNPGLFWYGIHGVEILYTFMGRGCEAVRCLSSEDTDVIVGEWADGRLGTVRGTRTGAHDYGATVFADQVHQVTYSRETPIYARLLEQVMRFFQGEPAPVKPDETLEIMAFMQAALLSSRRDGQPVRLEELE